MRWSTRVLLSLLAATVGRARRPGKVGSAVGEGGTAPKRRPREVEQRHREIEALNAVALTVNRAVDLLPTAEETLEVVRRVVEMDVGVLYRVDEGGETLSLVAQRGLSPELLERLRVRPVEGTHLGEAIRTGRPTARRGVSGLALSDPALEQTQLALPIPVKGEVWGVMALGAAEARLFTREEMQLFEAIAYQVGVAVERASLFAEIREKGQQLESLVGLVQTVTASLDLDEVLKGVVQAACRLIPESSVRLWVVEGDRLVLNRESGTTGAPLSGRKTAFAFGEGLAGHVAQTREPLVIDRVLEDARTVNLEWMRQEGYVSFAGIPLLFQDGILGVLAILTRRPHHFSKEEIELLVSFVTQAAISIENARLYAEASRRAAEHQALFEVAGHVGSTLRVERVLDVIVERARALLGVRAAGIFKLDTSSGLLGFERGTGLSPEFIRSLRVRVGEGTSGKALQYRAPAWSSDLLNDPTVSLSDETRALVRREGYRAVLSVPILIKGQPYGVLAAYWWEPHAPAFSEVRVLSALGGQVAVALENAQLYEAAMRRGKRLEALAALTQTLTATLRVEDVLSRVVGSAVELFGPSESRLWLVEEAGEALSLRAHAGSVSASPGITRFRVGEGLVGAIAATRAPLVVPDLREDPRVRNRGRIGAEGVISFAGAPLLLGDRALGVLSIALREAREFGEEEVSLLQSLATHAAIAIHNARLYEEVRGRLKETETLLAVGQALARNLPLQEAMRQVAREVARAFAADTVGTYFLDERRETLVPLAGYHVPKDLLPAAVGTRLPLSRFARLYEEARMGKPVWTSDAMNDPRFDREALASICPRAGLFAPTLVRGEVVGCLFLLWWTPGRMFSPAELRLVEGVAAQVGLALENADLARQTQEKLRETETLLSIGRALSSTLDLRPLLRHFLRQVTQTIDADSAGVWLADPATGWLESVVGYRIPPHLREAVRDLRVNPQESAFYAEGFRSKRAQVSSNVPEDPGIPATVKAAAPHRVQLFAPIVVKDRVIGAFVAVWWERTREFSERELALVEAMSSQAGVAVENARLFEDNRRRLEELSVLHELSRAVTGQLDPAELVRAIHAQVARILDARNMVIFLYDEASGEVEVALRLLDGEERPDPKLPPLGKGLVSRVLERRQPIRTDRYEEECQREGVEPFEDSLRYPHWLGVPMVAGDRTVGALILRSDAHAFSAGDERLLVNIAGLTALAFRTARLFDERTRAYEELATAQDQLIRTERLRALGEMASGVAHDFNNLLASILGRAQLLLRHVEEPRLKKWLQVIERGALDGARTVQRVQEFARIRRDQPFVAVDLNRVVQDALEVTQSRWQEEARSQGIVIEVTTDLSPIPPIAGDPAELREVLTNLILNAVDAMPAGGRLTLSTRADETTVSLTVSDTGVGMPAEVHPRIFDPFFTTKGTKGTGLGLSIAYGIVSRHGGRIVVESAERRGSTFHLTFPVRHVEPEPSRPEVSEGTVPPLRCLVVDDEQAVLDALGDLLTTGGHSVALVADGATAVERFSAEPFDLVFADLAMPGLNGWQVARAVKDRAPSVPVLLITGWGLEISAEELRAHGVAAVLQKPIKVEDILAAVATYGARKEDTS